MAHLTIQDQFMRIPPVTRTYTTACVLTTILVHLEVLSPFQLYYNPALIIYRGQIWRLFTTFLFFGSFGFNFLFNLIFTYRYCRMLEENHYHGKTAEFIYMFLFGGLLMAITGAFVQILFLGQAFTIMLVYIWARRNPLVRMNFFGLFNFQAPYLPWVLLGFSLLLGNSVAVDIMGIAVGHIYYYLEDVFPHQPGGFRILATPWLLKRVFDRQPSEAIYIPPEERPGGFQWGQDVPANNQPQDNNPPPQ